MKAHSKITYIPTTNPLNLVECPELHNAEVYETGWVPSFKAKQICMIMKDTKSSTPMFIKTKEDYDDIYQSDFASFIQNYKDQQLVENGRNGMIRELFTIDIDSPLTVYELFHALKDVIPFPFVLTQNTNTDHWQIQFYLKEPIVIKKCVWVDYEQDCIPDFANTDMFLEYSRITAKLAKYFSTLFKGCDSKYRGVLSRNVYCISQKSYVVANGKIHFIEEGKSYKPVKVDLIKITSWLESLCIRLPKNKKIEIVEPDVYTDSRHELTLIYGRKYVWTMLNQGLYPTSHDLYLYLLSVKDEIAEQCGKEAHSDKEIHSQVESIFNWAVEHYKPIEKNINTGKQWKCSIYWNINQRCAKIKRAKHLKKRFMHLKAMNYKLSEIAEIMNMSVVTLYTYLPLFAVIDLISTADRVKKMYMQKSWNIILKEINSKIRQLYNNMKESGLNWGQINFNQSIEDYEHIIDYNIPLLGNIECLDF